MADTTKGIARPRGRVKSCTTCRQVKLRCDALAKFPAACTRCTSQGLDCKIDSNFKRVSVRGRLEEMSRKVYTLQYNLAAPTTETSSANSLAVGPGPESCTNSAASIYGDEWLVLSDAEVNLSKTWCLGDIILDYRSVSDLLEFYALNYHEHLPILEKVQSVSQLHDSNPFLFWTILRTACCRHPVLSYLFDLFSKPYHNLLGTAMTTAIHDFRTIQAILILCYWPNSGRRQSQDASWQLCGLALNAAMQMALDQPGPGRPFPGFAGRSNAHQMSVYSRHTTWLSLFYVSTSFSVWYGLTPHLSSPAQLNTITLMSKDPEIPRTLMVQVEIQRQTVHYSTALAGEVDSSTCSTLLNHFSNELDNVFATYKALWNARLEVQLLAAKLYLFSLCLNSASRRKSQPGCFVEPSYLDNDRTVVQLGLPSAISLIHNVSKLNSGPFSLPDQSQQGPAMLHYPKYYFRLVMFAVVFLMKYLRTNPTAAQEDKELAISHITIAHQFFSGFHPSPDHLRVAEVIEILVKELKDEEDDAEAPIRTRQGASLMYDAMKVMQSLSNNKSKEPLPGSSVVAANATATGESADNTAFPEAGIFHDMAEIQLDIHPEDGGLQWMSDDMLFEMMSL